MKYVVLLTGLGVAVYAIGNGSGYGHLGVGWTLANHYVAGGILCMMFCFSVGIWMSRVFKPRPVRGGFWICSLSLIVLVTLPHWGTADTP